MSERIIIGENTIAGLPISAPLEELRRGLLASDDGRLRWRRHDDRQSFILQQAVAGKWVEVPCARFEGGMIE